MQKSNENTEEGRFPDKAVVDTLITYLHEKPSDALPDIEKNTLKIFVRLILNNCPNPVLLFDSEGKLAFVNDSFFQYCRIYERNGVIGKNIRDLFVLQGGI